jgi:hypothetical protein
MRTCPLFTEEEAFYQDVRLSSPALKGEGDESPVAYRATTIPDRVRSSADQAECLGMEHEHEHEHDSAQRTAHSVQCERTIRKPGSTRCCQRLTKHRR